MTSDQGSEPAPGLRQYYASRAAEYDQVYQKPERQQDISWLRAWLPTCFYGASVLDVAAGTGFWSQDIAGTATQLVAIDASKETLDIARDRLPAENVQFVVGDVYHLPFRASSFNAAFVGFWFSHVPKSRRGPFLTEIAHIVESGSTVVLLDNLYVEGSNHPVSGVDEEGNTYQSRRLADGTQHRVLKNFPDSGELFREVGQVGEELELVELNYYWAMRYRTPGR